MAIARKKNTGRPSNLDRQIKRSVELAPYAAYVPNPEEKASHLKTVLAVEGETVGTTNTQTLTNKTFPEPTSDSSPATKNYVDDKYSQTRYTHNQSTSQNPWAITHNLGYYPDVTIMQSVSGGGSDDYEEVEVHVQHNSINDLTINLSGVATGLALMR
jgi:hypothetical protein